VASIASTEYGLAALPIAVERGRLSRSEAADRAKITLPFLASHAGSARAGSSS
jgi:hypothetical protein